MSFRKRSTIAAVLALLPAIAVIWLPASPGWAATTYYVSISGNNANPGTQSSPWRTIQRAADTAGPGDTVVV
ncbi:MAG TPA: DUF1565 domain-containing protein, partial [Actinomycetota bacterium]|nr:DUF1565 domain-containing protein [Actinomycetota bacterium]